MQLIVNIDRSTTAISPAVVQLFTAQVNGGVRATNNASGFAQKIAEKKQWGSALSWVR